VGAVLQQAEGSHWRPLALFKKKLEAVQSKFSAFNRELWAAYLAVPHFRFLLEGRQFMLWSNHKPLSYALHRV
jgi:cleavage and polyadenylation specificity factor subunit 1